MRTILSACLLTLATISVSAQSDDKCANAISRIRVYASYKDSVFKDQWHFLILPHELDQKCLVILATGLHKETPEDKYEFFDAEGKELDKYLTYNRDGARARGANYSMDWLTKHSVATLQTEADPSALCYVGSQG